MIAIEANHLIKSYGKIKAIDDMSFVIEENKITGLIGRNGAGKTTLLKTMAGYLRPVSGEIKVYRQDPFNSLKVAANLIFVDDNMTYPASFTLTDIVEAAAFFYPGFDKKLATRLLEYFSLNPKQRHNKLSKGMRSTVNSIVGIAARCALTIFDEPTTGMDSAVRKDFYRALLKDYLEYPRTVILSSHLLNELEELLEDILLIKDGQKYLHLRVTDLMEYAVGIRGNAQGVLSFAEGREIVHKEEFAQGSLYVVLKNDFLPGQLEQARQHGLEVMPITPDDLCVYLTAKTKGGIDYVFARD